MIRRIASAGGRWFPVDVIEASPKQLRAGEAQYTAVSFLRDDVAIGGYGDTIEEAVDDLAQGVL